MSLQAVVHENGIVLKSAIITRLRTCAVSLVPTKEPRLVGSERHWDILPGKEDVFVKSICSGMDRFWRKHKEDITVSRENNESFFDLAGLLLPCDGSWLLVISSKEYAKGDPICLE